MSAYVNRNNFGLFTNGDFRQGTNYNFTFGTYASGNQHSGSGCIQIVGGGYGTALSNEYTKVDTSKYYQLMTYIRTINRSSVGSLAGGYVGFSCYDSSYRFIQLHMCGDISNTYLTRTLNAGDSYAYVNSSVNSWYTGSFIWYFKIFLVYPPSHPEFSTPYKYTRIGAEEPYICFNEVTDIGGGEIRLRFADTAGNTTTFPNIGYATPINTPVCNGMAGGTYNYALGNLEYPETWTKIYTPPFTGESRNSAYPFRYGTKYIQFMILLNYNHGSEVQDCVWALDDIFFGECENGKDYTNKF